MPFEYFKTRVLTFISIIPIKKSFSILQIICIPMLVLTVLAVTARTIPASSMQAIVVTSPYENVADALSAVSYQLAQPANENHNRLKREATDPYDAYYYYPSSLNNEKLVGRATVKRRQSEDSVNSVQSRRRKLFVPNLFG